MPCVCFMNSNMLVSYTIRQIIGSAAGREFRALGAFHNALPRIKLRPPFSGRGGLVGSGRPFHVRSPVHLRSLSLGPVSFSSSSPLSWTFASVPSARRSWRASSCRSRCPDSSRWTSRRARGPFRVLPAARSASPRLSYAFHDSGFILTLSLKIEDRRVQLLVE